MIEMNEKLLDRRTAEQQVQEYEAPKVSVIEVAIEKGFAASHGYNGFGDETNW